MLLLRAALLLAALSAYCCCWLQAEWQIFAKMFDGETITLKAQPADTVDNVKSQMQGKKGIPRRTFRLVFGGKQLEE